MKAADGHDRDTFFTAPLERRSGRSTMTDQSNFPPSAEAQPAADLLPEVYAELRRLAASLTTQLRPGQTLQPTALVHEAYLRLVRNQDPGWNGLRHFFGAAARAMREILIEQARRKATRKHGGPGPRAQPVEGPAVLAPPAPEPLAPHHAPPPL